MSISRPEHEIFINLATLYGSNFDSEKSPPWIDPQYTLLIQRSTEDVPGGQTQNSHPIKVGYTPNILFKACAKLA